MSKNLGFDISKVIGVILVGGYFLYCAFHPTSWHLIDTFDLIIHEAGHTIMRLFGLFIAVTGGTLFQILIPLIFCGHFFLRRDFFSSSLLMSWLGYNLVAISVYMDDAQDMVLPLLGGDGVIHDWNYLLSATHLLSKTHALANLTNGIGMTIIFASVIGALYFSRKNT